jgi:hypothetical protein
VTTSDDAQRARRKGAPHTGQADALLAEKIANDIAP